MLRNGHWLWKRIVTQELGNGRDRRLGVALFPVQDGPTDDSKLSCDFLLGEVQNKTSPPDMLAKSARFKIRFLWF